MPLALFDAIQRSMSNVATGPPTFERISKSAVPGDRPRVEGHHSGWCVDRERLGDRRRAETATGHDDDFSVHRTLIDRSLQAAAGSPGVAAVIEVVACSG